MNDPTSGPRRWYAGVTGYQWLVLVIASAGWVFDTFEGQVFNITRKQMLAELLAKSGDPQAVSRGPPGEAGRPGGGERGGGLAAGGVPRGRHDGGGAVRLAGRPVRPE